jgi:hypothetical protein
MKLLPAAYAFRPRATHTLTHEARLAHRAAAPRVQFPLFMEDDVRNNGTARPAPTLRTCPQCLNPHTVVAEERYRGLMRFCPMCDFSWVIGQVNDDNGRTKKDKR